MECESKMRIAIFGTKSEARYLAQQIEKNTEFKIEYFIDNNSKVHGTWIDEKKIISFDELVKLYEREIDAVIIAMRGTHSRLCVMEQLREANIEKVGLFKFSAHDFRKKVEMDHAGKSEYVIWLNELDKPVLPYLEINVADACNLNCKGCSHFSSLFEKTEKITYGQFVKDLKQVEKKTWVVQLRLLGGEPLLNGELYKFVEAAREIFPQADIGIVTNGLLIIYQNPELFRIMKEKGVGFWISKYKPVMQMKDVIEETLEKNEVDYFFERDMIYEFGRTLSMGGNSDPAISQEVCISRGCRFLRNGRLYKCPFEGLIDKFAMIYGYEAILKIERGFDIYDEEIDWGEKLDQYHRDPVPLCKYCAEKCEMFEWEVKRMPEKEDWLVV